MLYQWQEHADSHNTTKRGFHEYIPLLRITYVNKRRCLYVKIRAMQQFAALKSRIARRCRLK